MWACLLRALFLKVCILISVAFLLVQSQHMLRRLPKPSPRLPGPPLALPSRHSTRQSTRYPSSHSLHFSHTIPIAFVPADCLCAGDLLCAWKPASAKLLSHALFCDLFQQSGVVVAENIGLG